MKKRMTSVMTKGYKCCQLSSFSAFQFVCVGRGGGGVVVAGLGPVCMMQLKAGGCRQSCWVIWFQSLIKSIKALRNFV